MRVHPGVAYYNRSIDHLLGDGVSKDVRAAFRWNQRAAQLGYADAQLAMGWFYHNGFGVRRDLAKARQWYELAAKARDEKAWFSLGQLAFDQGEFETAAKWFRKAARRGHPRSLYYLGRQHLEGLGASRDHRKATRLLREAARLRVSLAARLLSSERFRSLTRSRSQGAITPRR